MKAARKPEVAIEVPSLPFDRVSLDASPGRVQVLRLLKALFSAVVTATPDGEAISWCHRHYPTVVAAHWSRNPEISP